MTWNITLEFCGLCSSIWSKPETQQLISFWVKKRWIYQSRKIPLCSFLIVTTRPTMTRVRKAVRPPKIPESCLTAVCVSKHGLNFTMNILCITKSGNSTLLPWTSTYVALVMTGPELRRGPQKYKPESDIFTCLILRKRVEMLVVASNARLVNPPQNEAGSEGSNIEQIQVSFSFLTALNHMIWVKEAEKLAQSSVTSSPGWTSTVWNSEAQIQPETENNVMRSQEPEAH